METHSPNRPLLYVGLLNKAAILLIGIIGIFLNYQNAGFMGGQYLFLYFTMISNIIMMLSSLVFLFVDIVSIVTGEEASLRLLRLLRFASSIGVALTMGVFFALLVPTAGPGYVESAANLTVHLIVPVLGILDVLVFERRIPFKKADPLIGALFPLLYMLFVYAICYPLNIHFAGNDQRFPYFFMDFETLGWFSVTADGIGTGYYIVILLAIVIAASYLLAFLHNLLLPKKKKGS